MSSDIQNHDDVAVPIHALYLTRPGASSGNILFEHKKLHFARDALIFLIRDGIRVGWACSTKRGDGGGWQGTPAESHPKTGVRNISRGLLSLMLFVCHVP